MSAAKDHMLALLDGYHPGSAGEAGDVARVRALVRSTVDPWLRDLPLHLTASALIVHPDTERVLLRWHERMQGWLQVGGHGDPGETDPLAIALREAAEETGLPDLIAWPDDVLRHVVVVKVPASPREPAHEHADLRYTLATRLPEAARPENPGAPVRWLTLAQAAEATREDNLCETLRRVSALFSA